MRLLNSANSVSLKTKLIVFLSVNLLLTMALFHSVELTVVLMIIANFLTLFSISQVQKLYKWRLRTLQEDAFFQNSDFSIGAYGQYSLIAVSKSFIRIVNVKSTISVYPALYDIAEVFPNYPQQGIAINLGGFNTYYVDVPIDTIDKVITIKNKDTGGFVFLDNRNFGIRLETKENVKIDIDTAFGKEFCEEISPLLTSQIATE